MPFSRIADAASFHRAVVLGTTPERRSLEFKEEYRWQKRKDNHADRAGQAEELCRDVAQFANRDGGTLLVGVGERATADGRKVADGLHSVEGVDGFKQWAEQAIRNRLVPSTFSHFIDTIVLAGGEVVVAINVPPSLHLVALRHDDPKRGIEYLYRTDHGKDWMNPDEVERHLMNSSRAMQLAINDVLDEVSKAQGEHFRVELTPPMKPWVSLGSMGSTNHFVPGEVFLRRVPGQNRAIDLSVNVAGAPVSIMIPHGLISEVWTANDGRVGLCLKVAIVIRGERELGLEPFTALA